MSSRKLRYAKIKAMEATIEGFKDMREVWRKLSQDRGGRRALNKVVLM